MRRFSLIAVATAAGLSLANAQADGRRGVSLSLAAQAVATVKADYFAMDYAAGADDGARLLRQFPASRELAAWNIANLVRLDRIVEARAAADAMTRANANDAWVWFARTIMFEYSAEGGNAAEGLKTSLEAYRRAPADPSIVWLRALALSNGGQSKAALALIDSAATRGNLTQELRTLRATATFSAASNGTRVDQATRDSSFKLYAAARANDSTDGAAYTLAASRMLNSGRAVEAYDLAKRGVALTPTSLAAHETYWRSIAGLRDRPQAARDSETFADVERLLQLRAGEPTVLLAAAGQFRSGRQPERARVLDDSVIAIAPASMAAEQVLMSRYRALGARLNDSTGGDTAAYRRALWAFIARPTHVVDKMLGDAYRSLFYLTDSTTNADTLLRIVHGMIKYEGINPHATYAGGAIRLAERGRDFAEAERIAREGLRAGRAKVDEQKSIYETVGDYAHAQDWMAAFMYDALGVVYMRQGRRDDARRELAHAQELDPKSMSVLYHLGQLGETTGQLDDAERYYTKGSLLEAIQKNPNRGALERVYKTKHGSLDGYSEYIAGLAETDRVGRRSEIAATRWRSPAALAPFKLGSLDGRTFTPDSLRGKIAVINNWGMWCGPCVAEMPELQKLATQLASDTGVRILTIDNDANTDSLRTWMSKKGFSFTTLLDDGYLKRINVSAYPTTWFVDAAGRVVFTKVGWSERLVEEFGWRIDMIRRPPATP